MQTIRQGTGDRQDEGSLQGCSRIVGCITALFFMLGMVASHATSSQSNLVAVDFENAELRVFIKFVIEVTGRVFLLDDRVRGQVSVVFTNKIPVDQLYEVFESVLEVKGYAAVPAGHVIKIVPLNTAKQRGIEVDRTRPLSPSGRR
ncbi:MAG: hypothetical protein HYZ81_16765 [Nitrospinae bacterium]|nr:hypothetical protein [Nitrospinota bacterium]